MKLPLTPFYVDVLEASYEITSTDDLSVPIRGDVEYWKWNIGMNNHAREMGCRDCLVVLAEDEKTITFRAWVDKSTNKYNI